MESDDKEKTDNVRMDNDVRLVQLEKYQEIVAQPDYVDKLKAAQHNYVTPIPFKVGDIVEWKPNMKMLPYPTYSAPVIVVRMLGEQKYESSSIFPTPVLRRYDMLIGFIDGDGDFTVLKADSSCFQPWRMDSSE
ncbi:hypothetical protein [Bombiscardovia coagulans]|nr:hypothetical protein [Bombiscardovia coagulans]